MLESNLATKTDVANIQRDIESLRKDTKTDIEQLRAATKTDVANIQRDIESLRKDTKTDIEQLRAATKTDIAQLQQATKADLAQMETRLTRWVVGMTATTILAFVGIVAAFIK